MVEGNAWAGGFDNATLLNNHESWSARLFRVMKSAMHCPGNQMQKLNASETMRASIKSFHTFLAAARAVQSVVGGRMFSPSVLLYRPRRFCGGVPGTARWDPLLAAYRVDPTQSLMRGHVRPMPGSVETFFRVPLSIEQK